MPTAQIPTNPTLPARFGRYVLLQPLGRGGTGEMFLAISGARGIETLCVVKRVLPHLRAEHEYARRFREEVEVYRRLSHPNLAQIQAVGQINGELFIAQEFVEGHDLSEVARRCSIDRASIPIEIIIHITREVARGLAYAHDFEGLSLVHRDINPANVRVTYSGDVKLLDFGLATSRAKTFLIQPGTSPGKRAFMVPEQLGFDPIDRRADIYLLGVLLWESLTQQSLGATVKDGKVVSLESAHAGTHDRMLNAAPTPPSAFNPEIPAGLDRVVLKALARSPADRFQSASDLRTALQPFLPAGRDVDVELRELLARRFDIEKERHERQALIAGAQRLLVEEGAAAGPVALRPLLEENGAPARASALRPTGNDVSPAGSLRDRAWTLPSASETADASAGESGAPERSTLELPRRRIRRRLPAVIGGVLVAVSVALALWYRHHQPDGQMALAVAARGPRPEANVVPVPPRLVPRDPTPLEAAPVAAAEAAPMEVLAPRPAPNAEAPAAPSPSPRIARRPQPSVATPPTTEAPCTDPAQLVSLATEAFHHGRFADAIRFGRRATAADAGAPAHAVLGNVYLTMRKLTDAEKEYSRALSLNPDDVSTRERLAIVREMLKREMSSHP